ncbi:MAG: HAD family hydrolase [Acidobacteria bacterium]|nr:HAD family hydrolase [Acidobacteriota bacterium]
MSRRAIFIDRDGTISEEVGYVNHLSRYRLLPRSAEALRLARQAGYLTVMVTNQAGVARGYFPESLVLEVHEKLVGLLREAGAELDGIYYCPHHPHEGAPPYRQQCGCRKPLPGLIERAIKDLEIDPEVSYIVGDSWIDIEAGGRAGMQGVLVLTGYGRGLLEHQKERLTTKPAHVATDLLEAVRWIIEREESGTGPSTTMDREAGR